MLLPIAAVLYEYHGTGNLENNISTNNCSDNQHWQYVVITTHESYYGSVHFRLYCIMLWGQHAAVWNVSLTVVNETSLVFNSCY